MNQRKFDKLNQSLVFDPSQLDGFKHNPGVFLNGSGNSDNIQDVSLYPADGVAPFSASQQQSHVSASSKDINQTMTFVPQCK